MKSWFWTLALVACVGACGGRPKYPSCDGDKDCQKGERCINKKCVACGDDSHCPPGKQCMNGACEAKAGYCAGDADCTDGKVCKSNACVACAADGECGEGGKCQAGKCLRAGACNTDADCPEDQDCVNGQCTKASVSGQPSCQLDPVYFGFDQYVVDEAARTVLQKDFECLSSVPNKVAVVGMTDPRGTVEYNIGLSDDRAQAVITYLGRLGIDPARMRKVPKGAGEAKGTDESGWSKDRRVELTWE